MESLAALGVAAALAQFISFTSAIVSTTGEIYTSAQGAASEDQDLESIHTTLASMAAEMEKTVLAIRSTNTELGAAPGSHTRTVLELPKECKEDCNQLLDVLHSLKMNGKPKSKWDSF
ncbi:hypothetical protein OQA88_4232 [Cercophora sp. LCS_1]